MVVSLAFVLFNNMLMVLLLFMVVSILFGFGFQQNCKHLHKFQDCAVKREAGKWGWTDEHPGATWTPQEMTAMCHRIADPQVLAYGKQFSPSLIIEKL